MIKLFTFCTLFFSSILIGQNPQLKMVDSIVESKLDATDPGLMVGVVKDGTIMYQKAKGMASLQHQVPVTVNSRSNIASTAKQFTALMVLDLAQKGKIDLEEDIRTFLPTLYKEVKEPIKVRHLINHTSGIRDVYDLMSIQQEPWWRREGLDNEDAFELLEKQHDLAFIPGSRHLYSNSGYLLLTMLIEKVTEEDFHTYSNAFFESLGMKETQFQKNYMHVIPNQALPYSDWGDGVWQQYPMITNLYGDGFLFTSLQDQLLFEKAVQNASANNNQLLIASQKPIENSEITTYGYGLELGDRLEYEAVHHSGGTGSYHSQMIRFPEQKLSVFVMSNNSRLWSGGIANEIAQIFLPEKDQEPSYDDRLSEVTDALPKSSLIGQYMSPKSYLIRIEDGGDGVINWRNGNNNPIAFNKESENVYSAGYDDEVRIGFFKDEMVLFFPSGKSRSYAKMAEEEIRLSDYNSYQGKYFSKELDVAFSLDTKNDTLMITMDGWKKTHPVEVLNRNELLIFDYIMKIERDQFDRVVAILLTTNRVLNIRFDKQTKLKFKPTIATDNGSISVTTIGSRSGDSSDIILTKNYPNGNEIWYRQFGGSSYDKASSILATDDGYLIIGSTSSYGVGNYDMFAIKTDKEGNKIWQNSYGESDNEYGYTAEKTENGYLLKGTIQQCDSSDVLNRTCTTNVWIVTIDEQGNELSRDVLEEIDRHTSNFSMKH